MKKKKSSKTGWIIGGGVVVVGGLIALLMLGGDDAEKKKTGDEPKPDDKKNGGQGGQGQGGQGGQGQGQGGDQNGDDNGGDQNGDDDNGGNGNGEDNNGGNGNGDDDDDNGVPACAALTSYTSDDLLKVLEFFDQLVKELKAQQKNVVFSGYPELGAGPIPSFPGESWEHYVTRVGMMIALARAKMPFNWDEEIGCNLDFQSDLAALYAVLYESLWGAPPWPLDEDDDEGDDE